MECTRRAHSCDETGIPGTSTEALVRGSDRGVTAGFEKVGSLCIDQLGVTRRCMADEAEHFRTSNEVLWALRVGVGALLAKQVSYSVVRRKISHCRPTTISALLRLRNL